MKAFLLLLLFTFSFGALAQPKGIKLPFKVYIIHSYLPGLWSIGANKGAEQALRFHNITNYELKIYDYDYVRQRKNLNLETKTILKQVSEFKPDLIMVFDDEAADDLIPTLNKLQIPIVASGINKEVQDLKWYLPDGDPNRNFTAILERYPFEEPLKLLKKLDSKITKISFLTTENVSSDIILKQLKKKFSDYSNEYAGIKLGDVFASKNWDEWQTFIKSKKAKNEAFWILVPWDVYHKSGKEVTISEIGTFYQKEAKIPELGIVNASSLLGMVACFSVNSEDLAFEAISAGIESYTKNKKLTNVPFEKVKSVRVVLNQKRADQLGIKIPSSFLDFAKIEKKIPLEYFR